VSEPLRVDAAVERDGFLVRAAFDAMPGRPLALVGPNGAGKSTLVAAIAGLLPLASGTIGIGGLVVSNAAAVVPPHLRRVGVVFQDLLLFAHLSVRDNVAFALRVRGTGRAEARAAAQPWLERFELDHLAERRPAQLSGGQAQRVALARAVASDPEVLLLDEPLASLDAAIRDEVRADLARHLREFGRPAVVVTHDAQDVAALADDVVVLQAGLIVQQGSVDELAARPATPYVARLFGN
jgi:molybdate transport system ATP-binding protein